MPRFNVNFAKLNIEINSIYDYTQKFCKDYITDAPAQFSVTATEEMIDREIEISEYNPSRPYAESICIYREIAEKLPLYDRIVFHGAVISYGDKGYLFTAPSGTGKTTHIRLWRKFLGKAVDVVNGDKPLLHITDEGVTAYATPYAGKEGYQNHSSIKLGGICIIGRGTENTIERISPSDHLMKIMNQTYRPTGTEAAIKSLELLDKLLTSVPIYSLHCDMSEEAVKCSFEALTGLDYNERKAENED